MRTEQEIKQGPSEQGIEQGASEQGIEQGESKQGIERSRDRGRAVGRRRETCLGPRGGRQEGRRSEKKWVSKAKRERKVFIYCTAHRCGLYKCIDFFR